MMSANPHIVVFGGKDGVLEFCKEQGVVATLVQYPGMLTEQQQVLADQVILLEMGEEHKAIDILKGVHAQMPITSVVTFYPTWLLVTSQVGELLGVRCNPCQPVEVARHKDKLRRVLERSELPQVRWSLASGPEDIERFLQNLGKPVIVKPVAGGGSAGVFKIDDVRNAKVAWEYATEVPYWANMENYNNVLLEEYVEGDEYSVESISKNGCHEILAIVRKNTTGAPHFIELGHTTPAEIPVSVKNQIHVTVIDMLNLMGQQNGPCHTEVKVDGERVNIIETQTRFGGGQIWELVWLTTGRNVAHETVAHLCHLPSPVIKAESPAASVVHLPAPEGLVLRCDGHELVRHSEGVYRFEIKDIQGKSFGTTRHAADRIGYCMCLGNSSNEAFKRCEQAIRKLLVETENAATRVEDYAE
ncbi:ATP-grasp domain-containing protein [Hahella ganghwensis]|uniref:ATP-grasp domain-containing protein n=1 Tax=Hahella ganghwensis TaxID=286420 RepID=UPI00037DFDE0|nr:ATP-grasp domain-containing protein [Hahella ganghwensis]